jgi:hypothetical protein
VILKSVWVAGVAVAASLALAIPAQAATLSVDDDGEECPTATYDSVQDAVDDADPGDTVSICPGTYTEGSGAAGTNALSITKSLTIRGAGADDVTIQARRTTPSGGQIAAGSPNIRDAVGNLVSIAGGSAVPITVDISGVTIDGNGVYSEVGVLFLDAQGSLVRSRVTDVVTSEDNAASSFPGGYRSNDHGYGVAQTTTASSVLPGAPTRPLLIDNTRVDHYNKLGILIDGATNDNPPLTASGVVNAATIRGSSVVGRTMCINFAANGNCASVGTLTTGPLFGQEGLRVTAGSTAAVTDSILTQNLVNGVGAPTRNSATNNANLPLGSGARFIGAGTSTMSSSNIVDNAYGVQSQELDGSTASATPLSAENNWWGLRYTANPINSGPAISPVSNPPIPENPVNGTATAVDLDCVASNAITVPNSTAVDFCPFRNGTQGDPNTGEWPVVNAPLPVSDARPTVEIEADAATYEPGDTVMLTAAAADDFGVTNVTFFRGANAMSIDGSPPYGATYEIPEDGPCGEQTFTAVSKDSSGQTDSDSVTITVDDEFDCEGPPDPPTISFTPPTPSSIPASGAAYTVTAASESGVDEVEFFLGTRSVCVDDTAPYTCNVLPNGDEVGDQILSAVVTADDEQTATASIAVTVEKFEPSLTIEMHKTRLDKRTVTRTVSGEVVLPDRVDQSACSGHVTLNIQRDGLTLFPSQQVEVKSDCTYELTFTIKERKKKGKPKPVYNVGAAYSGNGTLTAASKDAEFGR